MNTEMIGFVSGIIGCLSVLPQIYKSWKSGSSDDLSTNMLILMYIALILAIIYGIIIQHSAVYVTNSIAFVLYALLHGIKIYNMRKKYTKLSDIEMGVSVGVDVNLNDNGNN
jgi:MtN3 and saliva related transmembrane protein